MKIDRKEFSLFLTPISTLLLMIFTVSISFAYWIYITGATNTINQSVNIGEWDVKIHVMKNQSYNDEEYLSISLPIGTSLGEISFDNLFPTEPAHYYHSHIPKDEYTFIGWYKSNGEEFDYNEILSSDIYVYPSWESETLFKYNIGNQGVTLYKNPAVEYSDNLYIPGWRYKGQEIIQINRTFFYTDVDTLTIGWGVKKINYGAFADSFTFQI